MNSFEIVDIGGEQGLRHYYHKVLRKWFFGAQDGQVPYISGSFTSSDAGLALWGKLTCLPGFYQTREEIALLQHWGRQIAHHIAPGSSIIDLGSADVKKITPLLDFIEYRACPVTYYSLDVSRESIAIGLQKLSARYKHIKLVGLWGTWENIKAYVSKIHGPRFLLGLGAEIGNARWDDAVHDLSSWVSLLRPQDRFLLGTDSTQDREKIWRHYHDSNGLFEWYTRLSLAHTNWALGCEWYRDEDWKLGGELHQDPLKHCFVVTAVRDVSYPERSLVFRKGDKIECNESHRYTPERFCEMIAQSGAEVMETWKSPNGEIYDYLLASRLV